MAGHGFVRLFYFYFEGNGRGGFFGEGNSCGDEIVKLLRDKF